MGVLKLSSSTETSDQAFFLLLRQKWLSLSINNSSILHTLDGTGLMLKVDGDARQTGRRPTAIYSTRFDGRLHGARGGANGE